MGCEKFSVHLLCLIQSAFLSVTNTRACSNSCPFSWWCHLIAFCNVVAFPTYFQSFLAPKYLLENSIQCYGNLTEDSLTRWRRKRTCPHLLLGEVQNYNSVLNNHQQENVGSHQKKISHVQRQRKRPNKIVGGVKFCLGSNPIPASDTWRAQRKPCTQQSSETPQRLSQNCVWVSPVEGRWVSSGCLRGRGSGFRSPGHPACGISPLEGGHH